MSMRRGLRMRPVNSLKHVIDANGLVSAAVQSVVDIVLADANPDPEISPTKVTVGSVVNSIFLRVEVVGVDSAGGVDNIYMAVIKNPSSEINIANLDKVGISNDRKWVIHQEMLMLTKEGFGGTGAGAPRFPRTLFNGVIKIPPKYRRFGVKDKLQVLIQHRNGEVTQTTEWCLQSIYKEFR